MLDLSYFDWVAIALVVVTVLWYSIVTGPMLRGMRQTIRHLRWQLSAERHERHVLMSQWMDDRDAADAILEAIDHYTDGEHEAIMIRGPWSEWRGELGEATHETN